MVRGVAMKDTRFIELIRRYMPDKMRLFLKSAPLFFGEQWCRVILNQETLKLITALDTKHLDAMEISGTRWSFCPFRSYKTVFYPEFDICSPPPGISVDVVIAEQVFEHLLWPYRAGKAVYDLLRAEGYLVDHDTFSDQIS